MPETADCGECLAMGKVFKDIGSAPFANDPGQDTVEDSLRKVVDGGRLERHADDMNPVEL